MHKKINFFGLYLDIISMEETITKIMEFIEKREITQHVVVNVAKLVYAQKDHKLKDIINSAPLVNVDGAGIILGAKLLGIDIPQRVTGIDLMEELIKNCAQKEYGVYFFGAKEEIVNKVVSIYESKYPELNIAGQHCGYFNEDEEPIIVEKIKQSKPDILFVAMGSPKKELFLDKYKKDLQVPFIMGVGGSFDVVAGKTKRAPIWMQKSYLEWLYRLIQEPKRMWKRYFFTNCIFFFMLIKAFFTDKAKYLSYGQN